MVDYFSLAITHGLLALAALRLIFRADLDRDPEPEAPEEGPPPVSVSAYQRAKDLRATRRA